MIVISSRISLPDNEVEWQFVRAAGPGGQHVNKTSTAVRLVFDIAASSLPDECKQRLLALRDHRITDSGLLIIKSQHSRSQLANREEALAQLVALIQSTTVSRKKRRPTKPSLSSLRKRIETKKRRGAEKSRRQQKDFD